MTINAKAIYCAGCKTEVQARLTDGRGIYPHRPDLASLPFWRCDACRNFVGCHHKTASPTTPLGCIPTPEIKQARQHIHRVLDPLWKGKKGKRGKVYAELAKRLGISEYHTGEIRSVEEAHEVFRHVREMAK